jgi:PAS domain S-box-containing protein
MLAYYLGLFLLVLGALQVISLFGLPWLGFVGEFEDARRIQHAHLNALADARKTFFEHWISERRADVVVLAERDELKALADRVDAESDPAVVGRATSILYRFLESYRNVDALLLIDAASGRVITSVGDISHVQGVSRDDSLLLRTRSAGANGMAFMGKVPWESGDHFVIAHAFSRHDQPRILLWAVIDIANVVLPLLKVNARDGLGSSGELILISEDRHNLTPLLHALPGTTHPPGQIVMGDVSSVMAAGGFEGSNMAEDYRGIEVLSAFRHIRLTDDHGIGLIIKTDREEAIAPLRDRALRFAVAGGIAALIVTLLTIAITRHITRPLTLLGDVARRIHAGDLSARANLQREDEIGLLGGAFDSMAERLHTWHQELEAELERRAAHIRDEEGRMTAITQSALDAIVTTDARGTVVFWNAAAERLFGWIREEAMGRNVTQLVGEIWQLDATGDARSGQAPREILASDKNGRAIPIEISLTGFDYRGESFRLGIIRDASERKQYLLRLEGDQERMRRHADAIAELIASRAQETRPLAEVLASIAERMRQVLVLERIEIYSRRTQSMHAKFDLTASSGLQRAEARSRIDLDEHPGYLALLERERIVLSGPGSGRASPWLEAMDGLHAVADAAYFIGGDIAGLISLQSADARRRWHIDERNFLVACSSIIAGSIESDARRRAEQELAGYMNELETMVNRRTEALKQANEELQQTLDTLTRAQTDLVEAEKLASLGRLVAGVAHELNTPLGNSVTVGSALAERLKDFSRAIESGQLKRSVLNDFIAGASEGMDILQRSLAQAAELIHDFKQVAVDQTSSQRRMFDLATVTEEVLATLRPRLKKTPYQVHLAIPAGVVLDSYPGPLGQVITNLVTNAVTHAFTGRDYGTLTISAQTTSEGRTMLLFADDGVGIPTDVQSRIFDPFFTTRLGSGGTGLGLNIVHNIVVGMLGGRIAVASQVGEGTTFRIDIPNIAPEGAKHDSGA